MDVQIQSMKNNISLFILLAVAFGCDTPEAEHESNTAEYATQNNLPLVFDESALFPGDGSLLRAEDGVFLEDGRIVVVDQAYGLRVIDPNGSNRPFGDFASAGYLYQPPEHVPAPNGIFLEHDGKHIITSDVGDGKIYRVNIANEEVQLVYDHPYGVNTIYRDKTGALWLSQSTNSTNLTELFRDVFVPTPQGALYRMADLNSPPVLIADSLYFANGITMDQHEKRLYIAETMMDRVHGFDVNVESGTAEYTGVAAYVGTPDNVTIDKDGRLVVASPIFNQIVAFDLERKSQQVLFDGSTRQNALATNEWIRRSHLGLQLDGLIGPDMFHPLPGLLTGMFFSPDGSVLYLTNLGSDLLRYEL